MYLDRDINASVSPITKSRGTLDKSPQQAQVSLRMDGREVTQKWPGLCLELNEI